MVMRVDIEFHGALTNDEQSKVLEGLAALAKSRRAVFIDGNKAMYIIGEAMSVERLKSVFYECDVMVDSIHSSLDDEADAHADDHDQTGEERFRPLGRS